MGNPAKYYFSDACLPALNHFTGFFLVYLNMNALCQIISNYVNSINIRDVPIPIFEPVPIRH